MNDLLTQETVYFNEDSSRSLIVDLETISVIGECWDCIILDNITNSGFAAQTSRSTVRSRLVIVIVVDIGSQPSPQWSLTRRDGASCREKRRRNATRYSWLCVSSSSSIRCLRHARAGSASVCALSRLRLNERRAKISIGDLSRLNRRN